MTKLTRVDKFLEQQKTKKKRKNIPDKLESKISKEVVEWLNSLPQSNFFKLHIDIWNPTGQVDIHGCYKGRYLAIEMKRPSNRNGATALQKQRILDWIAAGAVSFVATGKDDIAPVLALLDKNPTMPITEMQQYIY